MVEGGILAPIFAMMMMMTVYLGGVYQTKYKTFMQARFQGWSYVSNACSNGSGDNAESAAQFGTPPESSQGQGAQAPGRSQAESSMFIGHAKAQLNWDYEPTYRFNGGAPKTITTESWAVCNEPKGMSMLDEIANIIKQAAGS